MVAFSLVIVSALIAVAQSSDEYSAWRFTSANETQDSPDLYVVEPDSDSSPVARRSVFATSMLLVTQMAFKIEIIFIISYKKTPYIFYRG